MHNNKTLIAYDYPTYQLMALLPAMHHFVIRTKWAGLCHDLEAAAVHNIYSVPTHCGAFPITVDAINTCTRTLKI